MRPKGYREYYAELAAAQKPQQNTAAYSRFVNRPVGRLLAVCATKWGLTPDQVTALSALVTLSAMVSIVLMSATVPGGILVAVLLALGYALDSADGQVARLTGLGSPRGEWFDHMVDSTKVSSLHLCVAVHWFRFYGLTGAALLVPVGYSVVASVTFFGMVLTDLLRRHLHIGPERNSGSLSVVRSIAMLPSDYGFLCLIFALLGWPLGFVTAYSLMALLATAMLGLAIVRWYRLLPGPTT